MGSFCTLLGKACQFSGQVLIKLAQYECHWGFEHGDKLSAELNNIPVRFPPFLRNGDDGCQLDREWGCGVPVTLALISHICLGYGHPLKTGTVPI